MWFARWTGSARIAAIPPLPAPSVTVGMTFTPFARAALIAAPIDAAPLTLTTEPSAAALRKNGEISLTTPAMGGEAGRPGGARPVRLPHGDERGARRVDGGV